MVPRRWDTPSQPQTQIRAAVRGGRQHRRRSKIEGHGRAHRREEEIRGSGVLSFKFIVSRVGVVSRGRSLYSPFPFADSFPPFVNSSPGNCTKFQMNRLSSIYYLYSPLNSFYKTFKTTESLKKKQNPPPLPEAIFLMFWRFARTAYCAQFKDSPPGRFPKRFPNFLQVEKEISKL